MRRARQALKQFAVAALVNTQLAIALYAVQVRGHKTLPNKTYMEMRFIAFTW